LEEEEDEDNVVPVHAMMAYREVEVLNSVIDGGEWST
jgi:hypothetical protein